MKRLLFATLLLAMAACTGVPVAVDYDTDYDFSNLETYAWLEPKAKLIIDPFVDNDLMNQRLRQALESHMSKRGFTLVADTSGADILVSYHLSSHEKNTVANYHSHFGYYPCRRCWYDGFHSSPNLSIKQYRSGSFIIDFIEPKKRELVWRGVSERRLPRGTPQQRDQFVNDIIAAIIMRFPG